MHLLPFSMAVSFFGHAGCVSEKMIAKGIKRRCLIAFQLVDEKMFLGGIIMSIH